MRLLRKITAEPDHKTIVFTSTKRTADNLSRHLRRDHYDAVAIHGDKTQNERDAAMADFRSGRAMIMIATDVAARGIGTRGGFLGG